VFAPPELTGSHTQWPWDRTPGGREIQQLAASSGSLPADLSAADDLDGDRLAALLDLTGPAVLVTHSLGALGGWLAANRRPGLVRAVVAVEPMGPPFLDAPGLGALTWGITASPLATEPPTTSPEQLDGPGDGPRLIGLAGVAVAVVTAEASPFAPAAPAVVEFLRRGGVDAELLPLADHGVRGNGHGVMLEANSDDAVRPIITWITGRS
jgi:pimeloyl-ACP methyl ester carboxylesterase